MAAPTEMNVSVGRMRRADVHRCKEFDLIEVRVVSETKFAVTEEMTYKNLTNRAHYVCTYGRLKTAPRYNSARSVTLTRKNSK